MTARPKKRTDEAEGASIRKRILAAAFKVFTENGYAGTSTLEIATRARVSKRELYTLVGNKQEMLAACIGARAERLRVPLDLPAPRTREDLSRTLAAFGIQLLREISDPAVIAVFRLAIAEAVRVPEVARTVDAIGGEASRGALKEIMMQAQAAGVVGGRPAEMAEQFASLLWGNLMIGLLLGVTDRPSPRAARQRAHDATAALLRLYP